MIDANRTIGYTEPLAVFIYRRSYLTASYKNVNHVDFVNYYQIYYALLFGFFHFIMIFIYECFVVHWYFNLKHLTFVTLLLNVQSVTTDMCRCQWPRGLRRRSAAVRILRSWVRISWNGYLSGVSVVCCQVQVSVTILSLVQRSPTWCVVVCDLETSRMRKPWPALGRSAKKKQKIKNQQKCKLNWIKFLFFVK